GFSQLLREF
ncbi:unnamed protein product, partial [Allacma fusca]